MDDQYPTTARGEGALGGGGSNRPMGPMPGAQSLAKEPAKESEFSREFSKLVATEDRLRANLERLETKLNTFLKQALPGVSEKTDEPEPQTTAAKSIRELTRKYQSNVEFVYSLIQRLEI
jgi:hypothetical protein